MRRTALPFAVLLAMPATLVAQEEQAAPPTVLTISYYQCPQAAIGDIAEAYEQITRPV